jgi:sortase A
MRRVLRPLSTVLIAAGVLLLVDAVLTLVWQEPVSAVIASRTQHQLDGQLRKLNAVAPSPSELRQLQRLPTPTRRIAYAAKRLHETTADGAALGRIVLPTLDKDFVMVDGDDGAALRKGPGMYPDTPLPGQGGTTGIAGHRTTYLAPFRNIDKLRRDDRIRLEMPYGTFTYAVQGTQIVPPTQLSVIRKVGYERIVLTACHPLYSAAKRIVVSARLVKVVPSQRISDVQRQQRGR